MIKIQAEFHPNPEAMTFHVNKKINEDLVLSCFLDLNTKKLSNVSKKIVTALLKIEGIESITINKYKVTIFRAPLFSWEELNIQETLMDLLSKHYQDAIEDIDVVKEIKIKSGTIVQYTGTNKGLKGAIGIVINDNYENITQVFFERFLTSRDIVKSNLLTVGHITEDMFYNGELVIKADS